MPRALVALAYKTQAGHRHQVEGLENEDAVFVTSEHPRFDAVLMVADGMGGHPRPQEASAEAVRIAREVLFDRRRMEDAGSIARLLQGALRLAHQAVRRLHSGSGRPPGTTLSLAVVAEGVLHVAHIGDGSVFLLREGQVRPLAGGEDRRQGNRPAQFLGQEEALEPELCRLPLAEGDRLLLCTDGLTRYFQETGPEALERVLGRPAVQPEAIVAQLLAHSRPARYDDDTTVALLEVTSLTEAPRNAPKARPAESLPPPPPSLSVENAMRPPSAAPRSAGFSLPGLLGAMIAGAALLAAGFAAGRMTVPAPQVTVRPQPASPRQPVSPEELRRLPAGNLVLVDSLGSRIFALGTRGGSLGSTPVELVGYQVTAGGRLAPAGKYRLDPVKQELTDGEGQRYPVEVDARSGAVRVLRGGVLSVAVSTPQARVFVDDRLIGTGAQQLRVPAGRHRVRIETAGWSTESEVEVPAGRTVRIQL